MSAIPLSRMDSVASVASVEETEDPAPLASEAAAAEVAPPEWDLLEQAVRVEVDLEREELCGTTELRVRLPTSPPLASLRLNCAAQVRVLAATLDGAPVAWQRAPNEANEDQVVPVRWQRTRDLASYRSVHGAIVYAAQDGELELSLPPMASSSSAAAAAAAGAGEGRVDALLVLRYVVSQPRGGVHFVRGRGGRGAAYAHTVGEAGAVRRWLPCLDRVELRIPKATLEVTADAALECVGSGAALEPLATVAAPAAAADGGRVAAPRRTWRFAAEHAVLPSQLGFLVGRLEVVAHPTLPHTRLALGVADGDSADEDAALRRELWPQLLSAAQLLPPLFKFLHGHLLAPCEARHATAARAAAAAAAATAAAAARDAAQDAADDAADDAAAATAAAANGGGAAAPAATAAAKPPNGASAASAAANGPTAGAAAAAAAAAANGPAAGADAGAGGVAGGGGAPAAPADSAAARRAALAPFREHTVCAVQGLASESCAFCGLVLLHASLLHAPTAIEPARPLRLALARALGGAWLASAVWLRSWADAWLLMAAEGRLVHAYVAHAFGRNEAVAALEHERRALCGAAAEEALVPHRAQLAQWGGALHPEQLFSEARRRKAPLVLHMLQQQIRGRSEEGEKAFARLMAALCVLPPAYDAARIDGTAALLRAAAAVCPTDLGVFFRQWVHEARPPPTLYANFAYNKRAFTVELVLQQADDPAEATLTGCELGIGWGEADREGDGSYAQLKAVPLVDRQQLVELHVDARRKRARRKRPRWEGDEGAPADHEPEYTVVGANVPLLWLRVDPAMAWMCRVAWTGRHDEPRWSGQPEFMCREQLDHDNDVASQLEAARALSTFATHSAVDALLWAVHDAAVFFRVRAEAADSLRRLVGPNTDYAALHKLLALLRERYFVDGHVARNDWSDLAEYHVYRAVLEAVGGAKDEAGATPPEVFELLLELLDDNDNAANPFDDGHHLGALLLLLGRTRAAADDEAGAVRAIVAQVRRHLQLDALQRSPGRVLSRCALQALCALELAGRRAPEWAVYLHYEAHGATAELRLAAADCLLRLSLLRRPAPGGGGAGGEGGAGGAGGEGGEGGGGAGGGGAGGEGGAGGGGGGAGARAAALRGGTLALALRLAEARAGAPLDELRLWQALLALLRAEAAGAAGRARLAAELDGAGAAGAASVQLLWQRMCGAGGHARLRFTLCEVWRACFDTATPRCLGLAPQPISHAQTHPAYTPPHLAEAGAERAKAKDAREERQRAQLNAMKISLSKTAGGGIVHARHNVGLKPVAAAPPQIISGGGIEWRVAGARDPRLASAEKWVEHYRRRAERTMAFHNEVKSQDQPAAPPADPPKLMIRLPAR